MNLLTLGSTRVSGTLPTELGNLDDVETLDASNCSISGTLPKEYAAFADLEEYNLGGTQISGTIPLEYQRLRMRVPQKPICPSLLSPHLSY
tara:strand:- start:2723 stop:2995 length:273 start_codon:yes stop_codon:yes gene_type:complete